MRNLIAIVVATIAIGIHQRRRQWNSNIATLVNELLVEKANRATKTFPSISTHQEWEDIPPVVQRYLNRALPSSKSSSLNKQIRSVRFRQTGQFQFNGNWVPFEAQQVVASNQPGFVWDAQVFLGGGRWLSVQVCDAWSNGKGHLEASFMKVLTVASSSSQDMQGQEQQLMLLIGEALRWLAETPLIPTVLLPSAGIVSWGQTHNKNNSMAKLNLPPSYAGGPSDEMTINVTFDPIESWMTTVRCRRPNKEPTGQFSWKDFEGYFSNYQPQEDGILWVPTHMECGWLSDSTGEVDLYFKCDNYDLTYEWIDEHPSASFAIQKD